ncbi:unnamed protein product [Bursaphelenchus okinawaensis]|uniref:CUB domain-containing protein n=1 Tax=Bursaphelenchus okinawaensis TaxID=465554 RepID=A0A811KJE8_9BILA|nr:unnamed protein product [Bursaphelenchus okinawaensis]CAG9104952.1 unnamed protein product [Bursaphelenchus okinawaensis]
MAIFSRGFLLFFCFTTISVASTTVFYRFGDKNNVTINNCILNSMEKLTKDTCLTFSRAVKPTSEKVISFIESKRCSSWQGNNNTVHISPECANEETCVNLISKALTNELHHYGAARHLNLKFNCTDKCTTFCHNGGELQENCTCKCRYGMTGKFCQELGRSPHYTDASCGIVKADYEGTVSLSAYPRETSGSPFCQWLVKPANPWERIEFEFQEMDLNSQDLDENQDCVDSFRVRGVKELSTQIPCNEKFQQLKGKTFQSDGDWVMFELAGMSPDKFSRGPRINYRIASPSHIEIRSYPEDAALNSAPLLTASLINSDGLPKKVHKIAVDSKEKLLAIVTQTGNVEVYVSLEKRTLLKKLGCKTSFFSFIEGKRVLMLVCSEKPGTSHLPEAIHLLDVDCNNPCYTYNRPRRETVSTAFCLTQDGLYLGARNSVDLYEWDNLWPSEVNVNSCVSVNSDVIRDGSEMRGLEIYNNFVVAVYNMDKVVILDMKYGSIFKLINFKKSIESIVFNNVASTMYFASSQFVCALNLDDFSVVANGKACDDFEPLMYYNKVKVKNRCLTIYCNGFPSDYSRDTCMMITDGDNTKVVSFGDVILDIKVVYDENNEANTLLLLLEHEFVALDLTDLNFNRLLLPYLNCIDFSTVTTVKILSQKPNVTFDSCTSTRCNIFNDQVLCDNEDGSYFCTAHQNGNVVVWRLQSDKLNMHSVLKPSDAVIIGDYGNEEEYVMDDLRFRGIEDDFVTISDENGMTNVIVSEELKTPTQLLDVSVKPVKCGLYDDRCDDDGYAVEVIEASNNLLTVGLNCGLVLSYNSHGNTVKPGELVELVTVNLSSQATTKDKQAKITPIVFKAENSALLSKVLNVIPQTPVRALSISKNSDFVAIGCSTGIIVYDATNSHVIFKQNFLSVEDTRLVLNEEKPLTRLKSMKQSVRRTFRKKDASMRHKPVLDREVAFRDTNSPWTHGFRCLRFYEPTDTKAYLYAGTGNGILFFFGVNKKGCTLFKEVRLAHRAPVCSLAFIEADLQSKLVVFTEEQIRSFNVENLKSSNLSYKITAKCGVKVKKGVVVTKDNFSYLNIICNDGTCHALSSTEKNARIAERFVDASDGSAFRLSDLNTSELITVSNLGTIVTLYSTTPEKHDQPDVGNKCL